MTRHASTRRAASRLNPGNTRSGRFFRASWLLRLGLAVLLVMACGCSREYVEREIGYKGRARVNPWLAAERFAHSAGFDVRSLAAWRSPENTEAMWLVPAAVLNNESFVRRVEQWVKAGGHLLVVVEHAAAEASDWREFEPELPLAPALPAMLHRFGIELQAGGAGASAEAGVVTLRFAGREFEVATTAHTTVSVRKGAPGMFASVRAGAGRVSVLADACPLRNRWIGEHQHAEFLAALLGAARRDGPVVFVRSCGLSFWGMLRRDLWPVLTGLAVLLGLWLWKSLSRFGPLEAAAAPATGLGYDHHLEALGNFHWRLDRAAGLLAPLREQILERAQRLGARDEELLLVLAARSGLPKLRVARALAAAAPGDSLSLIRCVADMQILLNVLT